MDIFARLKVAMELKTALERHKLSLRVLNDRERSNLDQPNKHDKFLADRYRNLMWCKHIVDATRKCEIPNQITVRFANVICLECTSKLNKLNWMLPDNERRTFQTVRTEMLEKLVDLYCSINIDALPKSKKIENKLTENEFIYT